MSVSGSVLQCSGLTHFTFQKLPIRFQKFKSSGKNGSNKFRFISRNMSGLGLPSSRLDGSKSRKLSAYLGRNNQELRFEEDGFYSEPFWVSLAKEAFGGLRSLLLFLIEQPSQLKYIEWPPFQSTLKTAALTLVLVAMLMVALFSVDSALAYLFSLLLRKTTAS